ncbi:putative lipid-binding transport protein, Tim44 family [Mariprofundus ferrinatatus]|uniref:Putative lipid-binding transport protein, Tim44 family n=1 Tax=Mariprofundus ferrinatatus TaxID=1921087 RepID=A0A2K8L9I7_9PROT|nr:TIM44-like domain-containing protein [Mariprofundus ferrinatatus]ATX81604.1 putative lipid-binding transport protein, Tim44 family [Mariprofundus ferrinatatus]
MRKLMTLGLIAIFGIMISGVDIAEAKRLGMGSSFGKQRMSQPKSNSFSQQKAAPTKQPAAANQRGAARTGFMGMLGGLALGGILGAMFFGGAFEGANLFDIVVIGGIIFLVLYFLRRRARPRRQPSYASGSAYSEPEIRNYPESKSEPEVEPVQEAFDFHEEEREPVGSALRPELDEKHFVTAAKEIYVRMQKAWDSGDIEDIRKFCTPEIAERIGRDMSPNSENRTEVATLNAEIADSWIESDLEWVAVNYNGLLREQTMDHTGATVEDQTAEVNEVWIFQHAPNSEDPTWYLAGIQQAH